MFCSVGHRGFPIGNENPNFVQDLPIVIPGSLVSIVKLVSEKKRFETFFP
jgi:hypothetical protein